MSCFQRDFTIQNTKEKVSFHRHFQRRQMQAGTMRNEREKADGLKKGKEIIVVDNNNDGYAKATGYLQIYVVAGIF